MANVIQRLLFISDQRCQNVTPFKPLKSVLSGVLSSENTEPAIPRPEVTIETNKLLKRSKLWEIDDRYHCPVIGTCLPAEDLLKIGRRFFCLVDPQDDFALHVEAVSYVKSRNRTSETIQKLLERKYRAQITRFEQAKTDEEVWEMWREHYAHGEVAGALWAAVMHRAVSATTQNRIFSAIHMLSHQIGSGQAANARRLARLESDNAEAKAALDKQKKHHARSEANLRMQLTQLVAERDQLRSTRNELERLQARLSAYESGSVMIDMGRKLMNLEAANEQMIAIGQHNSSLEKALKEARELAQTLTRERTQLIAERDALEQMLLADNYGKFIDNQCPVQCKSCDKLPLGQCVLYVGGRNSLLAHYRALAERLGIRLIHHDGGREESLSRLPDLIKGADAVMCPTDCVSHSAYYQLKRQCKRTGKPCLLFKGAGIANFALVLARLSANHAGVTRSPEKFTQPQLGASVFMDSTGRITDK